MKLEISPESSIKTKDDLPHPFLPVSSGQKVELNSIADEQLYSTKT